MCSDTAAFALQSAIGGPTTSASALVYALYLLESSLWLNSLETNSGISSNATIHPVALLKNTGLAHLHVVQSKDLTSLSLSPTLIDGKNVDLDVDNYDTDDVFHSLKAIHWPTRHEE